MLLTSSDFRFYVLRKKDNFKWLHDYDDSSQRQCLCSISAIYLQLFRTPKKLRQVSIEKERINVNWAPQITWRNTL